MKITIEADLPGENITEPIVYEKIVAGAIVGRVEGIAGQVNRPIVHRHGNAWDVYRLLGEGRDRVLVRTLVELKVVPVLEGSSPEPAKEPTPDAAVH